MNIINRSFCAKASTNSTSVPIVATSCAYVISHQPVIQSLARCVWNHNSLQQQPSRSFATGCMFFERLSCGMMLLLAVAVMMIMLIQLLMLVYIGSDNNNNYNNNLPVHLDNCLAQTMLCRQSTLNPRRTLRYTSNFRVTLLHRSYCTE